ncbi:hypothetical protein [Streptomyces sp. NK08204]|uniref:hypothetical protein n=1 Tax=Streptomyces sp. NK08204 TaxID=2873260 RepID=UPI001CEC0421|nr:hypothetical protein [Streptomyces sp. NK08204]
MELRKPSSQPQQPPEGCLVVALRIPLRVLVFLLVVPVRLAWDAVVAVAGFLWRCLLAPVGRAIGWVLHALLIVPLTWLYRWLLTPLGHALVWLYVRVLTPVGHAILWVLTPVGRALARSLYWITRVLLVLPALALWRWILAPVGRVLAAVGREIGTALGHAWRVAGHVSRAVGRVLGTLFRWIFLEPLRWVYRTVLTPVGHVVRDLVLRPAAQAARAVGRAVRQARADLGRMLFGEPRQPVRTDRREPESRAARTLERSTTALTKD